MKRFVIESRTEAGSLKIRPRGSFSPQIYSVSLPRNLASYSSEPGTIPEPTPAYLTFLHELNHVSAYASSAFGLGALTTLNRTVVAMSKVSEPIPMPIPIDELTDFAELFSQAEIFQYYFHYELGNVGGKPYHRDPDLFYPDGVAMFGYPITTPLMRSLPDQGLSIARKLELVRQFGSNLMGESWLTRPDGADSEISTKLNATSLFEALAILAEVSFLAVTAWKGDSENRIENAIDELDDLYGGVLRIYRDSTSFPTRDLAVNLGAIIDVAFMQDEFVLSGRDPWLGTEGVSYKPPMEWFFDALLAAKSIGSFSERFEYRGGEDELFSLAQDYQDLICRELGIPSTQTQTKRAIEWLVKNRPISLFEHNGNDLEISELIYSDPGTIDYRIPFALHYRFLQLRANTSGFFMANLSPGVADLYLRAFGDHLILVDSITRVIMGGRSTQPLSTLAAPAILELLSGLGGELCPYQRGQPFFCAARWNRDSFCTFHHEQGYSMFQICPFYLFGSRMKDPPGNKALVEVVREAGLTPIYGTKGGPETPDHGGSH